MRNGRRERLEKGSREMIEKERKERNERDKRELRRQFEEEGLKEITISHGQVTREVTSTYHDEFIHIIFAITCIIS